MPMRELSGGTRVCPEIRINSIFYSHNNIVSYLALDDVIGHVLVHLLPAEGSSLETLEKVVKFYRDTFQIETRCGQYEEFLYFSEPFPLGEFMFEWLERRERVSLVEALKRVVSFLKILTQAHENGIYHGRITPQSILVERTGMTLALRMMGLGTAQALNTPDKYDIDWFDYTFDMEGMSPASIDIYGVAIVLMGLVSGEQGIDSFESTGLLPQPLRGGMIQQAMERALALRIDAYTSVLDFSLDLEAALLEADERQGEVYVSDLVGFESAVKSIASISREAVDTQQSGEWNAIVDTLEQEQKSSLLCSLTSLTAIKPVSMDDEDEDVTCVTSLPQQVLGMQRIKAAHSHEEAAESTSDLTTPSGAMPKVTEETVPSAAAPVIESEDYEDEDDSPTRVMMRPTYTTISFGQADAPGVQSSIEAVLEDSSSEVVEETPVAKMERLIRKCAIVEMDCILKPGVFYPEEYCPELPAEDEVKDESPQPAGKSLVRNAAEPPLNMIEESEKETPHLSKTQKTILRILIFLAIFLILIAIIAAIAFSK